jgi:hypothetical protein
MCQALEDQLAEKAAAFSGRERELQEFNRIELERGDLTIVSQLLQLISISYTLFSS